MKCKPGDLAVVLSAFHKSNVGRFVSVVELYDRNGALKVDWEQPVWLVESTAPLTWTRGKRLWRATQGPVPDAVLQPIRGRSGDELQSDDLPEPQASTARVDGSLRAAEAVEPAATATSRRAASRSNRADCH